MLLFGTKTFLWLSWTTCTNHLRLFPGSGSDLKCWCPTKSTSFRWTDEIVFYSCKPPLTLCCMGYGMSCLNQQYSGLPMHETSTARADTCWPTHDWPVMRSFTTVPIDVSMSVVRLVKACIPSAFVDFDFFFSVGSRTFLPLFLKRLSEPPESMLLDVLMHVGEMKASPCKSRDFGS